MSKVSFGRADYLGGLPDHMRRLSGRLWANDESVGFGDSEPNTVLLAVADLVRIDIESTEVAKSKVPAALAFGMTGAAAARGSETKTQVTMHCRDGALAYFHLIFDLPFARSLITPWLQEHNLLAPAGDTVVSLADELERVAQLHAAGTLTDVEFVAAKSKLLGL